MRMLHQLDEQTQHHMRWLLSKRRAIVLVHPLFCGASDAEREDRINHILSHPSHAREDKELSAGCIRRFDAEYLQGLQISLDNTGYTVGIVFESEDTMSRVQVLEGMDHTGRPWVVVPTHVSGADPCQSTWEETIRAMVTIGVTHADVGGCYLTGDETGRMVNPDVYYSCVNQVLWKFTDAKAFTVGIMTNGVYVKPFPRTGLWRHGLAQ